MEHQKNAFFHKFSHKVFGILIAFTLWWIPLGLHRLWMHRPFWWLHPVAFATTTIAINRFVALNIDKFNEITSRGAIPHISDYSNTWLFFFSGAWMALLMYDWFLVWTWPVPSWTKTTEGNCDEQRQANR